MKLNTKYMGLELPNPIIVGSSSLTNSVDNVKTCEKKGAGAVVLKSLYEEQILADGDNLIYKDEMFQWYPEALDFVNNIAKEEGLEKYLKLIKTCKERIDIPVIASINCFSASEWIKFASELENAGADALELNISIVPDDENIDPNQVEQQYISIVKSISQQINIPVAVKISAYFSNLRRIIIKLCGSGANSIVLFNRYYRPDIDVDSIKLITRDTLSAPEEITHSLRWIGILSDKVNCDLVASTGIHDAAGIIKQILAGASTVQVCSALYENGIAFLSDLLSDLKAWMQRKGFDSVEDFRGLINKDPRNSEGWERIHFIKKSMGNIIKPINL
jgi:dihydroorotate dehydrogenase (fumarate)